MSRLFLSVVSVATLVPVTVFGQETTPTSFSEFVNLIVGIINSLIYIVLALTVVVFMWGTISAWILNGGDAEKVAQGRRFVLYSIIALVLMTSLWGVVNVLRATLFGA